LQKLVKGTERLIENYTVRVKKVGNLQFWIYITPVINQALQNFHVPRPAASFARPTPASPG
jgi:hypothetical protein